MVTEIGILPDHSRALRDLVNELMADEDALSDASISAPTPGESPLPAVQAYTYDGDADQTSGIFVADVHFFAATYAEASRLARTFDSRMMRYPHRVSSNGDSVLLDSVGTVSIPTEVPWVDDNSIRRFQATYSVSFRR